jgi:hypothetical protein
MGGGFRMRVIATSIREMPEPATLDEARRIAANIAKPPNLLAKGKGVR